MTGRWHWLVQVGSIDRAAYTLAGATIRYGRSVWYDQPDPPTARLTLLTEHGPTPQLLDPVTVDYRRDGYTDTYGDTYTTETGRRFTGRVIAIDYAPGRIVLSCTGNLERVNRAFVGDTPWPAEFDTDRISRILALTGVPYRIEGLPRVTVLARDVDRQPAGRLARDYATWGAGMLTERRDGTVVYLSAERLSKPPRVITPPAGSVLLSGWRSALESGDITNRVSIGYGIAPEGGLQPAYELSIPASVAAWGDRYEHVATKLSELADAQEYAAAYLANRATPYWQMPTVTVAADLARDSAVPALASLDAGDMLDLPSVPTDAPYAGYAGLVQGWVETITETEWRIEYQLARADTAPLGTVTWAEPDGRYTWGGQTVRWDQSVTIDNLTPA